MVSWNQPHDRDDSTPSQRPKVRRGWGGPRQTNTTNKAYCPGCGVVYPADWVKYAQHRALDMPDLYCYGKETSDCFNRLGCWPAKEPK